MRGALVRRIADHLGPAYLRYSFTKGTEQEDFWAQQASEFFRAALMAADLSAVCGPRGKHNPDRAGVRHGTERGSVTLGGRRVPVASGFVGRSN